MVHWFTALVKYLFTLPGVKYFLSQKLCKHPLEKVFGCQRQRGGTHENPDVLDFSQSTQAVCKDLKRGNCHGNQMDEHTDKDNKENMPLPKWKTANWQYLLILGYLQVLSDTFEHRSLYFFRHFNPAIYINYANPQNLVVFHRINYYW